MFVGDTLAATAAGSSCTLSGISQLCSAVLYSEKYRQVCRAECRRKIRFCSEDRLRVSEGDPFNHMEISLLQAQSARNGTATRIACGRIAYTSSPSRIDASGIQLR